MEVLLLRYRWIFFPWESSPPLWEHAIAYIDSVNISFTFKLTNNTSDLKLTIEIGEWDAFKGYTDETYNLVRTEDINLNNYGFSILFSAIISSEADYNTVTTNTTSGLVESSIQTSKGIRIYDLTFGDTYDLGMNGSSLPSYTTFATNETLHEDEFGLWHTPDDFLNWWTVKYPEMGELPSIPPVGLEESSFLYRICYPVWSGTPFHHDPRYKAYFKGLPYFPPTGDTSTTRSPSFTTTSSLPVSGFLLVSVAVIPVFHGIRRIRRSK